MIAVESNQITPLTFADAEARLAESLPGYESRPQQQALARKIEEALQSGQHLLGQAGCGTGKSFGYLIPAIQWATQTGQRVAVATATKALQDQIANGDLPFLSEHLGIDFSFAVLKGRSNYLCMSRLNDPETSTRVEIAPFLRSIDAAIDEEGTSSIAGERDDFDFEVTDDDWRNLTVSSEECPGRKECPFGDSCFAEEAKRKAKEANLVVVNHALYFTDLMVQIVSDGAATMLGPHDVVVFDEFHEAEEYASNTFGTSFTEIGVKMLARQAVNFANRFFGGDEEIESAAKRIEVAVRALWEAFSSMMSPKGQPKPTSVRISPSHLVDAEGKFVEMVFALRDFAALIQSVDCEDAPPSLQNDARSSKKRLAARALNTSVRFTDVVAESFGDVVRWIEEETTRRGEKRIIIKALPINVSTILRPNLFDRQDNPVTVIGLSATLMVDGKFDYIASRLGCEDHLSIDVGTPFDFSSQARLFIPKNLPNPKDEPGAWSSRSINMTLRLVSASEGRALLLFSSRRQMELAYSAMVDEIDYTCMKQGDAPNRVLADRFASDNSSVLFATRSFFTGVDFQGDTCSLVVMDKLPFPVPTEPLTQARMEAVVSAGGNDFMDYTIPVMSLVLQQGFGRLIRHRNDRGAVAILDPRLATSGYGRVIINSLPPAPRLHSIEEVEAFYEELARA